MEKDEAKLNADKAAIESMRKAQVNMTIALDRISNLECALKTCAGRLEEAAKMLSGYKYNSNTLLKDDYLASVAQARKVL